MQDLERAGRGSSLSSSPSLPWVIAGNWGRGRRIARYGFLGFHTNSRGVAVGTPKSLALQVGAEEQGVSFIQNLVRKANLSPTQDLLSQRPSVGLQSLLCAPVP